MNFLELTALRAHALRDESFERAAARVAANDLMTILRRGVDVDGPADDRSTLREWLVAARKEIFRGV
jgi:hypothetical protein